MSHYIIGKDKLINVDYKNKDDSLFEACLKGDPLGL